MMDRLEIDAALQVNKPAHIVYEAIVDPEKMSNYFISHGSGRLEHGATVHWRFPEFDFEFPVRAHANERDRMVSFYWQVGEETLLVTITLEPQPDNSTVVRVKESSMKNDEVGIRWLKQNTEGWANFLACMKAYLEYGVNLRKGAFNFLKK